MNEAKPKPTPITGVPGGTLEAITTARFRENKIVRFLLEQGPFDMNKLAIMEFSDADRMQFAMLIGYSVGGFGELPYAHADVVDRADAIVEAQHKDRP